MAAWYRQGLTLSEVARLAQRASGTVRRHLRLAGIKLRPSFREIPGAEVRKLYDENQMSIRGIARHYKISYGLAHRLVTTHASVRPPGNSGPTAKAS
jgi:hypothetical protein